MKIFISRSDAANRRIVNERPLLAMWNEAQGNDTRKKMQITTMATFNFRQQLALARNATLMIGKPRRGTKVQPATEPAACNRRSRVRQRDDVTCAWGWHARVHVLRLGLARAGALLRLGLAQVRRGGR